MVVFRLNGQFNLYLPRAKEVISLIYLHLFPISQGQTDNLVKSASICTQSSFSNRKKILSGRNNCESLWQFESFVRNTMWEINNLKLKSCQQTKIQMQTYKFYMIWNRFPINLKCVVEHVLPKRIAYGYC